MAIPRTEDCTTPVAKVPPPFPCDPTSDRPLGLDFNGEELKDYIRAFKYDWTKPVYRNDKLLETVHRLFDEEVESGRYPPEALTSIKRTAEVACFCAESFYDYHPFELMVQISVYTTVTLEIDDLCERDAETMIPAIERYIGDWGAKDNNTQHHYTLEHTMRVVTEDLRKWYGPISMGNIIHSTIGYLQGCLMEAAYPDGVALPVTASRYPRYLRLKSGVSEAFSQFIFPETMFPEKDYFETYIPSLPDMTEWTYLTNDILSFYKESVAGTYQNTYLMALARVLGRDPVNVWRDTVKRALALADEITASLSRKEELNQAWLSYVSGYFRFHATAVGHKRYRLAEIGFAQKE